MPYPGVPKNLWPKMERCVDARMKDPKFKDKYSDPKERKSHAIAICHSSIVGDKKGVKIDMPESLKKAVWTTAYVNDLPDSAFAYVEPGKKDKEGKTAPRSKRHLPYKDKSGKVDPAHVRNALARLPQTNISAVAKAKARKKLVAAARSVGVEVSEKVEDSKLNKSVKKGGEITMKKKEEKVEKKEVKKAEEKEEVKKQDEVVEEKASEEKTPSEEEASEEKESEEESDEKSEEGDEESEAGEKEGEKEEEEKEETEKNSLSELSEKVDTLSEKLDGLVELMKQASPEEAADEEEAPEEEAPAEEASEEESKGEASEEEAPKEEESKKADTSSEGASELAKVLEAIEKLEERVNKVEKSPAPAKVIFSKVFAKGEDEDDSKGRLAEINERLAEILKVKEETPEKYNGELVSEATELIKEKKKLKGDV